MSKIKKVVKISENDLVNLIDNIVTEAVEIKKKEWITEQAAKGNKTAIFEQKLAKLEATVKKLQGSK